MARKLSVVTDGTKAAKKPAASIKDAVDQGERDLLVALRRKAASEIDSGVPAHALSPLIRQLRDLDKEIRALDARAEEGGESAQVPDEVFDPAAV